MKPMLAWEGTKVVRSLLGASLNWPFGTALFRLGLRLIIIISYRWYFERALRARYDSMFLSRLFHECSAEMK